MLLRPLGHATAEQVTRAADGDEIAPIAPAGRLRGGADAAYLAARQGRCRRCWGNARAPTALVIGDDLHHRDHRWSGPAIGPRAHPAGADGRRPGSSPSDATILATAVPSVVRDLGGFAQFPWLFSVYLLAQAVSVPIYAKLADIVGRKPLMLFGIGLFLAGIGPVRLRLEHALADRLPGRPRTGCGCRAADGHHDRGRHLHGGRARQGAGLHRERVGGVVRRRTDPRRDLLPARHLALDLLRQRAAVPGRRHAHRPQLPRAGGSASSTASTTRARRCSPPPCRCSSSASSRAARPGPGRRSPSITVLGAGARAAASSSCCVERRAAEPVLPLWVLSRRLLATTTMLGAGGRRHPDRPDVVRPDLPRELPRHRPPRRRPRPGGTDHRLAHLGHPLGPAALPPVRLPHRRSSSGWRSSSLGTGDARPDGAPPRPWPWSLSPASSPASAWGWSASPSLIAAQASVEWHERGVATGTNMFARSIGQRGRCRGARSCRERRDRPLGTPGDRPGHCGRCRRGGLRRCPGGCPRDDRRRPPHAPGQGCRFDVNTPAKTGVFTSNASGGHPA